MTVYAETGPYPIYFGVCFSEREYCTEMKRLKIKDPENFVLPGAGATIHWHQKEGESGLMIVCMDAGYAHKNHTKTEIYGLLSHECVHAMQYCMKAMREKKPGKEIEAYFVQHFFQFCMDQYDKYIRRYRKGRK